MSRVLRIFVDTSVFGGCFDSKFEADSRRIVELARTARIVLIISDVVLAELEPAPEPVRAILQGPTRPQLEVYPIDDEVADLRDAYLSAGVLTQRWIGDATHVATATVARADALVSWNFKHIVRLDRIKAFNQVNLANGYGILMILSPAELREYESRDDSGF
ncbi:MAG: hypothetical protein BroJett003_14120 [Planctomycetota bacterium]|nr:MAG: hypothetical protein BroJett003_14120 [Planctomycetota bacterium]